MSLLNPRISSCAGLAVGVAGGGDLAIDVKNISCYLSTLGFRDL